MWGAGAFLALTLPFLLFPDGHLPSKRWRVVGWASVIGIVTFVIANAPGPGFTACTNLRTPSGPEFGVGGRGIVAALRVAGAWVAVPAGLAPGAALFSPRFGAGAPRRSSGGPSAGPGSSGDWPWCRTWCS